MTAPIRYSPPQPTGHPPKFLVTDPETPQERRFPKTINGSRKRRIAAGAGLAVQDVNRLLKNFARTQKLMKKLGKKGRRGNPLANIPGF